MHVQNASFPHEGAPETRAFLSHDFGVLSLLSVKGIILLPGFDGPVIIEAMVLPMDQEPGEEGREAVASSLSWSETFIGSNVLWRIWLDSNNEFVKLLN
jgi:hypothetical protein